MSDTITLGPREIDALARIAYAEARGEGAEGMRAVVATVLNRAATGRRDFGGRNIIDVLNHPRQYTPVTRAGSVERLPPAPPEIAREIASFAASFSPETDPTLGATFFNSDGSNRFPSHATIGGHTFHRGYGNQRVEVPTFQASVAEPVMQVLGVEAPSQRNAGSLFYPSASDSALAPTAFGGTARASEIAGVTPPVRPERLAVASGAPFAAPLDRDMYVTSGFGPRQRPTPRSSAFHPGVDLRAPQGTEVRNMREGTVVRATPMRGGAPGRVAVRHSDGSVATYLHANPADVRVGQEVRPGEVIGRVHGKDAYSTGPHLDIRMVDADGRRVNPTPFIDQVFATREQGILTPPPSGDARLARAGVPSDVQVAALDPVIMTDATQAAPPPGTPPTALAFNGAAPPAAPSFFNAAASGGDAFAGVQVSPPPAAPREEQPQMYQSRTGRANEEVLRAAGIPLSPDPAMNAAATFMLENPPLPSSANAAVGPAAYGQAARAQPQAPRFGAGSDLPASGTPAQAAPTRAAPDAVVSRDMRMLDNALTGRGYGRGFGAFDLGGPAAAPGAQIGGFNAEAPIGRMGGFDRPPASGMPDGGARPRTANDMLNDRFREEAGFMPSYGAPGEQAAAPSFDDLTRANQSPVARAQERATVEAPQAPATRAPTARPSVPMAPTFAALEGDPFRGAPRAGPGMPNGRMGNMGDLIGRVAAGLPARVEARPAPHARPASPAVTAAQPAPQRAPQPPAPIARPERVAAPPLPPERPAFIANNPNAPRGIQMVERGAAGVGNFVERNTRGIRSSLNDRYGSYYGGDMFRPSYSGMNDALNFANMDADMRGPGAPNLFDAFQRDFGGMSRGGRFLGSVAGGLVGGLPGAIVGGLTGGLTGERMGFGRDRNAPQQSLLGSMGDGLRNMFGGLGGLGGMPRDGGNEARDPNSNAQRDRAARSAAQREAESWSPGWMG